MTKPQPSDTEILEFLLSKFQMHSPKMNEEHSWVFVNDYYMKNLKGKTAKDAIISCMKNAENTKQFQEWLNK